VWCGGKGRWFGRCCCEWGACRGGEGCLQSILQMVLEVNLSSSCIIRIGQNHVGVYTVFLAGKPPNLRSHTVYIYGSGQPYV